MRGAASRPSTGAPAGRDHYSYKVYADPDMADRFDDLRFSGPIGSLVAAAQEEQLVRFLAPHHGRTILDVGTGTGRAAIVLARRGARVTGVDASAEMLQAAEHKARDAEVAVTFVRGDAHSLTFPDRGFDAVVCLRVLMHVPDWRASLRELCRVARERLVFDYPSLWSAAALQAGARRVTRIVDARVEAYRVFSPAVVREELARTGFGIAADERQFVLPIALHKRVGSAEWTQRIERSLERAGLTRRFGSPVTVLAERRSR
jgi:SAM-dependent methyltransferase